MINDFSCDLIDAISSFVAKEGMILNKISELSSERISDIRKQFYIFRNDGGNFFINDGEYVSKDVAIVGFINAIRDMKKDGRFIKFCGLFLPPKGIVRSEFLSIDGIAVRYLKDYRPSHDDLIERWDIMVE